MPQPDADLCRYGTPESPAQLRRLTAGPLSFLYAPDALRRISWHGTELIRAIAWPIRDEMWGTWPVELAEEVIEEGETACHGRLAFSVAEGALRCALRFRAEASGAFEAELTMVPEGKFRTNRAGFTVLHPIRGLAGHPLTVTHPDGTRAHGSFPRRISPDQPAKQIAGLRYSLAGATADITFSGEVFEMEDQRNWSDASYKTYCVPLVHPFTYTVDSPITQGISVHLEGGGAAPAGDEAGAVRLGPVTGTAPEIGLVAEPGWLAEAELAQNSGATALLARLTHDAAPEYLSDIAQFLDVTGAALDAEIVLPQGGDAEADLARAARTLDEAGLSPARVIALTEGYLDSHQPSGPWPEGPAPAALCPLLRRNFPEARVGGGVMTNFTEFNRCRPDPEACDYVTHASTAIVHAGDDLSVLESLECLPQIFESAEALSGGLPYRLGLVSIGMRSNPYGADVAANPQGIRRTMARNDPRHRGLFGAAWAVGVLAATEGSAVSALCLAAPSGPFGLGDAAGSPWPLFHVIRTACAMAGQPRRRVEGLPEGVVGLAAGGWMMLANVTDAPRELRFSGATETVLLDEHSFSEAGAAPDWLDKAAPTRATQLTLAPFATAFTRMPKT